MEELKQYLLGDLTGAFMLAFYIFAIFGMVLSMLLHYGNKVKKNKRVDKSTGFSMGYWLKDNMVRAATNLCAVFVVMRFKDDLPLVKELSMFVGFLTGMSIDVVIIALRKYTKVNIFQAKDKA